MVNMHYFITSLLTMAVTIQLGEVMTLLDDSAHQAVSRYAEYHIDMVSCVHRKCQIRAVVYQGTLISRLNA